MNNYLCQKCKTSVTNSSTPVSMGCPSGGSHQWYNLGQVGTHDYQCKKCSTHVKSSSTPVSMGCPSGGSHQWNKLT